MATYRGQDGSVTVATVAWDELSAWSLDGVTMEVIDDTVKGDTVRTFTGGLVDSGTMTLRGWLDYVTAQQDVIDLINAGTGAAVAFVLVVTSTGPKQFTGNAVPASYSINSPEGSALVDITMTLKISGAVAVSWT